MLGVPTMHAGIAKDTACSIPKLKETDGCITTVVEVSHPRSSRPAFRTMVKIVLLIEVGIGQIGPPCLGTLAVNAVDSIDAGRIQLHVCQVLASVPRQRGVSVEMQDPVLEFQVS